MKNPADTARQSDSGRICSLPFQYSTERIKSMKTLMKLEITLDDDMKNIDISCKGNAPKGAVAILGLFRLMLDLPTADEQFGKEIRMVLKEAMNDRQMARSCLEEMGHCLLECERMSAKGKAGDESCIRVN